MIMLIGRVWQELIFREPKDLNFKKIIFQRTTKDNLIKYNSYNFIFSLNRL